MAVTIPQVVDDSRSRLVAAAAELVHAESYHSVGVKAICDRARVRRGSFYHFFESKQSLVLEAVDRVWDDFSAEVLAVCRDRSLPPRERIEQMIGRVVERHERDQDRTGSVLGCSFGNLTAESSTLDDTIRCRLVEVFDGWAAETAIPIAEAQDDGEITSAVAAHALALDLVSELQGFILMAKVRNDPSLIGAGGRSIVARLWGDDRLEEQT